MARYVGLAGGVVIVVVGAWNAANGSTSSGVAILGLGALILATVYARVAVGRRRGRGDDVGLLRGEILAGWFGMGLAGIGAGVWLLLDHATGREEFAGACAVFGGAVFFGYGLWATLWLQQHR